MTHKSPSFLRLRPKLAKHKFPILLTVVALGVGGTVAAVLIPSASPGGVATAPASAPAPLPRALPASLTVPTLGITSVPLLTTGLNPDHSIEVPPLDHPESPSWYKYSPSPGEVGPSVILGHVNAYGKSGVFISLEKLKAGDPVSVGLSSGASVSFRVSSVSVVDKTNFPTSAVYGNVDHPALRLITCGGALDPVHHRYLSNVIVYADKT